MKNNNENLARFWVNLFLSLFFLFGAFSTKVLIDNAVNNAGFVFYLLYTFFWLLMFALILIAGYFAWQLIKGLQTLNGTTSRHKKIENDLDNLYRNRNFKDDEISKPTPVFSNSNEEKVCDTRKDISIKGNQRKFHTKNH